MDPNETLRQLRNSVSIALKYEYDLLGMSELFQALDEWLTNGGFLPEAWECTKWH